MVSGYTLGVNWDLLQLLGSKNYVRSPTPESLWRRRRLSGFPTFEAKDRTLSTGPRSICHEPWVQPRRVTQESRSRTERKDKKKRQENRRSFFIFFLSNLPGIEKRSTRETKADVLNQEDLKSINEYSKKYINLNSLRLWNVFCFSLRSLFLAPRRFCFFFNLEK